MSFVFDICEKLNYFEIDTKLATFKIPDLMHITYPLKLFVAHYHLFATSRCMNLFQCIKVFHKVHVLLYDGDIYIVFNRTAPGFHIRLFRHCARGSQKKQFHRAFFCALKWSYNDNQRLIYNTTSLKMWFLLGCISKILWWECAIHSTNRTVIDYK